ncbi:putative divalent heavy-metal cations transporter [Halalkaliarchaeum sp. AArc-CO]|uniref:ZIP family metal transporter n=1 Tax=Halalkaliarchaeum sp. AArc-CO TaxID=2866381 RepID=UPI00217E8F96|nr:ZIP family metal transporter [Halalkaliarchaeum sp. AArc-CO]UWG49925.1 putative divalent heavy-metal cations transporter [Halalkaliarchaeum sp. AArc-CO]
MPLFGELAIVFVAGLLTGLATGLGVLPFFLTEQITGRWLVALWGIAAGVLLSAASVGLLIEGATDGEFAHVAAGCLAGIGFVYGVDRLLADYDLVTGTDISPDRRTIILVVGVLTLHSLPEGVAVGVAFADVDPDVAFTIGEFGVSTLAVSMLVAISIINVPEGLAIAIPLVASGMGRWRVVGWAVFSGLPQPIGAVGAYVLTASLQQLLPVSFGFAAGALLYLVVAEFLPAGVSAGEALPGGGRTELAVGTVVGFLGMLGLLTLL